MEREGAADVQRLLTAGEISRLGELLEDQELLDLAPFDPVHVAAGIDVGQDQPAGLAGQIDTRRHDRFPLASPERRWLVALQSGMRLVRAVDQFRGPLAVHHLEALRVDDQEAVVGEGIWVAEVGLRFADRAGRGTPIRTVARIDDRNGPHVFGHAVSGRERGHDLARAGDRFGVEHGDPGELVAEEHGHARTVRVDRPKMMVEQLVAVDILPPRIEHSAIGQHPGRVFVLGIAAHCAEVLAVAVAAVEDGDPGVPAGHRTPAAAGDEHDPAVGQVGRLDVVVRAVGHLDQTAAVGVDFAEVIGVLAALAIREEDLATLVMDDRIADPAFRIIEEHLQLTGSQVEPAETSAFAVRPETPVVLAQGRPLGVLGIVAVRAEVAIPMVAAGNSLGKHNLLDTGHRPIEEPAKQRTRFRVGGNCAAQAREGGNGQ